APAYLLNRQGKVEEAELDPLADEGSVVAPGFSTELINDAFDAEIAGLEAGKAGISIDSELDPAIGKGSLAAAEVDELLLRSMRENQEKAEEAPAVGVRKKAHGLQGAGGRKGIN